MGCVGQPYFLTKSNLALPVLQGYGWFVSRGKALCIYIHEDISGLWTLTVIHFPPQECLTRCCEGNSVITQRSLPGLLVFLSSSVQSSILTMHEVVDLGTHKVLVLSDRFVLFLQLNGGLH